MLNMAKCEKIGCVVLWALLLFMIMGGCSGGEGNRAQTIPAGPLELQYQVFTFSSGTAFDTMLSNQAVTVTFGQFDNTNTSSFQLQAGGHTASGTVTLASCTFEIALSSFPSGEGPQQGEVIHIDPCEVDVSTRALIANNAVTGERSVSAAPSVDVEALDLALAILKDDITGLIGDASCNSDSQCQVVGFGSKPCGGVRTHLVYSTVDTDVSRLTSKVSEFNELDAERDRLLKLISTCDFVLAPDVACTGSVCVARPRLGSTGTGGQGTSSRNGL